MKLAIPDVEDMKAGMPIITLRKNSKEEFIEKYNLPVKIKVLKPDIKETFWVKIIGYGYPPPTSKFRWCTDVLKIRPTNRFIKQLSEKPLVITGERYREGSVRRKISMQKRAINEYLAKASLGGIVTFSPLSQWSTNMVWSYLLDKNNFWRDDNINLYEFYKTKQDEKMNHIMFILTIVSAIFLPLTLVTGFFGMNTGGLPFVNDSNGTIKVVMLSLLLEIPFIFWIFKQIKS